MPDKSELRHLALAATPGPWKSGPVYEVYGVTEKGQMKICDIRGWGHLTGCGHGGLGLSEDQATIIQNGNRDFIAAANPQAVIALLDEAGALRRTLNKALTAMYEDFGKPDDSEGFTGSVAAGETMAITFELMREMEEALQPIPEGEKS